MSLGESALAYVWVVAGSGVEIGIGTAPEIRVEPLTDGRETAHGAIATTGYVGGACGGGEGRSPNAVGRHVLYVNISSTTECENLSTAFEDFARGSKIWRSMWPEEGLVVALASDHSVTYWIRDIPNEYGSGQPKKENCEEHFLCGPLIETQAADCEPPDGTCTLMQTTELAPNIDANPEMTSGRPIPKVLSLGAKRQEQQNGMESEASAALNSPKCGVFLRLRGVLGAASGVDASVRRAV
jgi:hypothetical protein